MKLTNEQQKRVNDNIRLVQKVINDKISGSYQLGIYSYDDIFQIGCIGLCKAASTDKGGTFSTYAYRLIWNEICDALIYSTRRQATELSCELMPMSIEDPNVSIENMAFQMDLECILEAAKRAASPCVVKGIDALRMMSQGYSSKEIGAQMGGASAKLVCAWISKARKFLRECPELQAIAG